jgi:hypothetical protein
VGREEKGGAAPGFDLKMEEGRGRGRGGKTEIRGGKPGEIWAVGFA